MHWAKPCTLGAKHYTSGAATWLASVIGLCRIHYIIGYVSKHGNHIHRSIARRHRDPHACVQLPLWNRICTRQYNANAHAHSQAQNGPLLCALCLPHCPIGRWKGIAQLVTFKTPRNFALSAQYSFGANSGTTLTLNRRQTKISLLPSLFSTLIRIKYSLVLNWRNSTHAWHLFYHHHLILTLAQCGCNSSGRHTHKARAIGILFFASTMCFSTR